MTYLLGGAGCVGNGACWYKCRMMRRPLAAFLTRLSLAPLFLCLSVGAGCYNFKPVTVHIVDAETGAPIERARVCV